MNVRLFLPMLAALLGFLPACGPQPTLSEIATVVAESGTSVVARRVYHDYAGTSPSGVTERLVVAPDGRAKLELLELNGLARSEMTSPEMIAAFDRLAQQYAAGHGNFALKVRDFHVVDLALFEANYSCQVLGDGGLIAGRPTFVSRVMPRVLDRPWYEVWVDVERHSVLKYIEHLPTGEVAAEMETQSIEFNADTSNETFPVLQVGPSIPVTLGTLASYLPQGFKAWLPVGASGYLPAGFVESAFEVTTLVGFPTIRWRCTDGVQELIVAEYQALQLPPPSTASAEGYTGLTQVDLNVYGSFVSTDFALGTSPTDRGTQIHVLGKVDPEEIELLVESLTRVL